MILLHGIWMPGIEMSYAASRLRRAHGFDCRLFGYASVRRSLDDNARSLSEHLRDLGQHPVHLVGHSLGGIIALRALHLAKETSVERVVCLGSPLRGSKAARALYRHGWGRSILGKSLPPATVEREASEWAEAVAQRFTTGVIAGNTPAGLGRLFARFEGENDGTVAVEETRLPGIRDHIVLPVSHTGMVFSKDVVDQAAAFLKRAAFSRD